MKAVTSERSRSQYGTDHEQLDLNPEVNLQEAIEEMVYYADEPNADAGALPVWYLSKLCKPKVTVMLSGEGATSFSADIYLSSEPSGKPEASGAVGARCSAAASVACFG